MGVCISPGGACWAYSGFMRFRRRLAWAEGFDLFRCESYVDSISDRPEYYLAPDYQTVIHEAHVIRWKDITSPLRRLFNHSDSDGFLTPKECAKMVDRLSVIVESFPDDDYDKQEGRKLVSGMRYSIENRMWMRFR